MSDDRTTERADGDGGTRPPVGRWAVRTVGSAVLAGLVLFFGFLWWPRPGLPVDLRIAGPGPPARSVRVRILERPRLCLPWQGCDLLDGEDPALRPQPDAPPAVSAPGVVEFVVRPGRASRWPEVMELDSGTEDHPWTLRVLLPPPGPSSDGPRRVVAVDVRSRSPLDLRPGPPGGLTLEIDSGPMMRVSILGTGHCHTAGRDGWKDGLHATGARDDDGGLQLPLGIEVPIPLRVTDTDPFGVRPTSPTVPGCEAALVSGEGAPWAVVPASVPPSVLPGMERAALDTILAGLPRCPGGEVRVDAACERVTLRLHGPGPCTVVLRTRVGQDALDGLEARSVRTLPGI